MSTCRSPGSFGADRPPFRQRVEKKRESRGERLKKTKAKEDAISRGIPTNDDDQDEMFETLDLVPRPVLERALITMAGYSARYHWIGIYVMDGDELRLEVFRGEPCPHDRISLGEGLCGGVAASGTIELVADVSREPRHVPCHPGVKSEAVVPIRSAEGVLGVIDVESNEINAFGDADRRFLEKLAAELGRKIEAYREEVLREAGGFDFDFDEGADEE